MDERAFQAFYDEMNRPLWAYIYRQTGSSAVADDVVQEAFYKFLQKPPDKSDPDARKAYLYRIATRLTKDHWRSSQRRRDYFQQRDYREVEPASRGTTDHDLSYDVERLFEGLSVRERSMLWLAYVEDYKHKEIAEIMELKPKSIRVLLYRARKKLADVLEQANLTVEDLL